MAYRPPVKVDDKGRVCRGCEQYKPWTAFGNHPLGPRGKACRCLPCDHVYQAQQRQLHPRTHRDRVASNPRERVVRTASTRRYATRKLGLTEHFTSTEWEGRLKWFDHRCAYCFALGPISVDHVIPLSRGGKDTIDNVVPACGPCNSSKGASLLEEWLGLKLPLACQGPKHSLRKNAHV